MVKKSSEMDPSSSNSGDAAIKYKGVRKRKWGKWVSEIRLPNSRDRIWLGSYDSPVKAARAFDAAQFCLRGSSANFNFPDNPPDIPRGRSMTPPEIQAAAAHFANLSCSVNHPQVAEEDSATTSYSPSVSEGAVMESEVAGVEASFYDHLSLSGTLGSGNYAPDLEWFTGFEEWNNPCNNFYPSPQVDNFDHGNGGDDYYYDASPYQSSYLWNF